MTAGLLLSAWKYSHSSVWQPLIADPDGRLDKPVANDVYCELFREAASALKVSLSTQDLADIIDDPDQSRAAFQSLTETSFSSEEKLVAFFENCYDSLFGMGGDDLANYYFSLLDEFVVSHNLRYELRQPCVLCPTLTGVFAMLVEDLRQVTLTDAHLSSLRVDFESSVRDLRSGISETRIKTCIQKQFNLMEALGRAQTGVTKTTLGAICEQLTVWPHESIKESVKGLYKFGNDFPGIRHSGTPANAIRPIDMRDFVAMSVVLVGFTPYLEARIRPSDVYGGSNIARVATSAAGPNSVIETRWKRAARLVSELIVTLFKG